MRLLTDSKDHGLRFATPNASLSRVPVSSLDPHERRLWTALGGDGTAWTSNGSCEAGFWRRLVVIRNALRSQFDALHEVMAGGTPVELPVVAVALAGERFRGQRGRPWSALEGNLFLTVGLPIGRPAAALVPGLVMLPALAVTDGIRAVSGSSVVPSIKWVNDILIGERKVGGVLASTVCRDGMVEAAVLGVGVNVAASPELEPTPFVPCAGSLRDAGVETTLPRILSRILESLATRYHGLMVRGTADLLDAYRSASCVVGRRVRVWEESVESTTGATDRPAPLAKGVVTSIGDDLSLAIEGHPEPVVRGRLAFEEVCESLGV
jgi:biotin-[acetyl-CoA-carboxylase] ligase BirA-like protein